jgi:hypothetical protein
MMMAVDRCRAHAELRGDAAARLTRYDSSVDRVTLGMRANGTLLRHQFTSLASVT